MALLLIRHGETEFNAGRVIQFPDTPLGPTGLAQAERLARRLVANPLALVLCSDYRRARMTADAIIAATGAPLIESPSLRERNFGDLRGRAYASLGALDPFASDYAPPNGESWATFHARVDRAWDELLAHAADRTGDIAVVTHGLVLRSLLERRLDASGFAIAPDLVVANTSVTLVDATPPWRVTRLGCTEHLAFETGTSAAV
ncbi:MAG: histidine phosphatase family protein [Gammaproteobacteria bacterium]